MIMSRHLIVTVILAAAMLGGCERKESEPTPAESAAASQRAVVNATAKAAADTKDAADAKVAAEFKAAADKQAAADRAATDTKKAADAKIAADLKAAAAAKEVADRAAADTKAAAELKAGADAEAAQAAADQTTAEVTSLLKQLTQYIQDNKLDLAEKTLNQLDGMKGSLPASLQNQIEAARTALKAKQTAGP